MRDAITYDDPMTVIELNGGWPKALNEYCIEHPRDDVCKSFRRAVINEDVRFRMTEIN